MATKIQKRAKYAVYGWIREAERELQFEFISSITDICILYYNASEIFEIISDHMSISEDGKILTKFVQHSGLYEGWKNCSYGLNEISSMDDIVYKWDLKINARSGGSRFGLSSVTDQQHFHQKDVIFWLINQKYCI